MVAKQSVSCVIFIKQDEVSQIWHSANHLITCYSHHIYITTLCLWSQSFVSLIAIPYISL